MEGLNNERREVQAAFLTVFCEKLVFYKENEKHYTTVTPVVFRIYMCPQIFITIGLIIQEKIRVPLRR